MPDAAVSRARASLAARTRHHPNVDHSEARRDLAAANLEAYIRRVVDSAPPLSPSQRDRLALLLRGGAAA